MKWLSVPLALVAGLSLLIGTAPTSALAASAASLNPYYSQSLDWSPCGSPGAQCARLRVPRDYSRPDGGDISLLVERVRATSSDRIGAMVLNPGGPGVAGASYAQYGDYFLGSVASRFDFVGFDPRGVGRSSPIACMSDRLTDEFVGADASPDTPAELRAFAQVSRRLAESCVRHAPDLYSHIGTYDSARDLDILRAALGERTLNFLGLSYGTRLGAVYAHLFPERVGRMILDGAINPANTAVQLVAGQGRGFTDAMNQFVAHCVENRCAIGANRRQVTRRINTLLASLDERPIAVGARQLTQPLALNGMLGHLYSHQFGWTELESQISDALRGNGDALLSAADDFLGRSSDGTYPSNLLSALNAISCWDGAIAPSPHALLRTAREAASTSAFPEITLQLVMSALPCHYWPATDDESPEPIVGPATRPILVIGTRHDPATPWVWARQLATQLLSGVLVTWEGNGHTATGRGSACIRRIEERYLATGSVPRHGTVCT